MLETTIRKFLSASWPLTTFAWQGGEPTLAGLDFYRRAIAYQGQWKSSQQVVRNAFQTNGFLLDREWALFLSNANVLVGLSIDGPASLHDILRVRVDGSGSHAQAIRAWELLCQYNCATNILCVVHRFNCEYAEVVYKYFTDTLGASYLQFIPCLDPADGSSDYSLRPGDYGQFLLNLFNLWFQERKRSISVKLFDDIVLFLAGKPMQDCSHRSVCESHLVIERDGSVYPCDFFCSSKNLLGNIVTHKLDHLLSTPLRLLFRDRKTQERPSACRSCRHLDICQAGCCRFWLSTPRGYTSRLCTEMRFFLDGSREQLEQMAAVVREQWKEMATPRDREIV